MPSSNSPRFYARFIPSEEVNSVTQWKFGSVDGSEPEPEPETDALPELPPPPTADEITALCEQARQDGFAQGYEHGRAEASLEWQQRMDDYIAGQGQEAAQRAAAVVQELHTTFNELQQTLARQVLELACEVARQVVRQELTVRPEALEVVVSEAVGGLLAQARPALVRLHPEDAERLQGPLRERYGDAGVQWVADPQVPPGGCWVESAGTVIDGTVAKRWERAVAALGLQSAWDAEESADVR
ncbi:FliH/SctL family protein [Acidovorax lacteus]|uniref:Flagellar assembly protein FliH n=1 Tax=Acidovorax lacteus TaxID=1924988 RepID=A0ABP8KWI8_9BURK